MLSLCVLPMFLWYFCTLASSMVQTHVNWGRVNWRHYVNVGPVIHWRPEPRLSPQCQVGLASALLATLKGEVVWTADGRMEMISHRKHIFGCNQFKDMKNSNPECQLLLPPPPLQMMTSITAETWMDCMLSHLSVRAS